jgi:hypothetical protein
VRIAEPQVYFNVHADSRSANDEVITHRSEFLMPKRTDIKTILLIGAGPIVIGQACEFDYSGTQACKARQFLRRGKMTNRCF